VNLRLLALGAVIWLSGAFTVVWAPHKPVSVQTAAAVVLAVIGLGLMVRELLR
jgi:hypothetical protein